MKGIKKRAQNLRFALNLRRYEGPEFQLKADYNGPRSFGGSAFPRVTQKCNISTFQSHPSPARIYPTQLKGALEWLRVCTHARTHTHSAEPTCSFVPGIQWFST